MGRLERGRRHRLLAMEPRERTLVGTLVNVDPAADPASRTFRLDNESGELPGGFAVRLLELEPLPVHDQPPNGEERVQRPPLPGS